jgi:hypothetical protein
MVGSEDGGSILHRNMCISTHTNTRLHKSTMIEKLPAVKTCKPMSYQLGVSENDAGGQCSDTSGRR